MRTVFASLAIVSFLAVATITSAQTAAPPDKLSQADLEDMLGPIALYPDSLLANVLAASVYPDELTKAAKFVKAGGKPEAFPSQQWEPPVEAVAQVPDALSLLGDNIDWTAAIGQAYLAQPQDVTTAIQSLRAKAENTGALQSSDQQTVVQEGSTIIIESAQPDVVYVPQYNPAVVYGGVGWGTVAASAISFGAGCIVGAAFNNLDCDWHGGGVSWGNWGGYRGNVDIDNRAEFNRNINTGDINVNNRPRPGNEGQRWTPNRDKMPLDNGRPRTDKLAQFQGDRGRQAMNNLQRPTQLPAARPGTPAGGTPLNRVNAPAARPGVAATPRPATPSARPATPGARPATPSARPATPSARPATPRPSATPSAFNRSGASNASVNRGASSRGRSPSASGGGGGRSGGAARGGGGGGRGGGRR